MRSLPKSITVLGRKIKINYKSEEEIENEVSGAGAYYDTWSREITVCKDAPKHIQKQFLLHEVTHAMLSMVGIDQKLPVEFVEIICQSNATLIEELLEQV